MSVVILVPLTKAKRKVCRYTRFGKKESYYNTNHMELLKVAPFCFVTVTL